ncbi:MAG: hypothetical protein U0T84_10645 [Chitinophagales bacterium]
MKKFFFSVVLVLLALMSRAQCAMCTAVADEAARNGSSAGEGINKGVLYLFVTPYLIVGVIGFLWWRSKKRAQLQLEAQ